MRRVMVLVRWMRSSSLDNRAAGFPRLETPTCRPSFTVVGLVRVRDHGRMLAFDPPSAGHPVVLCTAATGMRAVPSSGFYARGAEGWFWYAEEPPEPEEPSRRCSNQPIQSPRHRMPGADAGTACGPRSGLRRRLGPTGPAPLSAAWLRANLERYRDSAIDDPSPRNVALYLYLQRLAIDKAERFAEATQRAVWSDPLLDETTRRPLATFAANLVNREAAPTARRPDRDGQGRRTLVPVPLRLSLLRGTGAAAGGADVRATASVQAVSLDGRPLPGGFFPDFRHRRGPGRPSAWSPRRRCSWPARPMASCRSPRACCRWPSCRSASSTQPPRPAGSRRTGASAPGPGRRSAHGRPPAR
jgi:hypothetical protein